MRTWFPNPYIHVFIKGYCPKQLFGKPVSQVLLSLWEGLCL